jgi:hypothetical protein
MMLDGLAETLSRLGFDEIPPDDPDLPRGCVPYLPCTLETLRELVDVACVLSTDVFVDIGAGVGRAMAAVHLCSGARVIGLEIQATLAQRARELLAKIPSIDATIIGGDAGVLTDELAAGTVFLLYCPFGGERLAQVLAALQRIAQARPIRVCTVDLPLLDVDWLQPIASATVNLAIYRSR